MKILLKDQNPLTYNINIIIHVDKDIFDVDNYKTNIAASTSNINYLDLFDLPKGDVISQFIDKVDSQMIADFESFIEQVEDFLTDNCDLSIAYQNRSKDNSFYYVCFAKDSDGNLIAKFELRIRISNHVATRNKKKQDKKSEEKVIVKNYLENHGISASQLKKMNKLYSEFIVNDETFTNYDEAFMKIVDQINHKLDVIYR